MREHSRREQLREQQAGLPAASSGAQARKAMARFDCRDFITGAGWYDLDVKIRCYED